jgi:hypothetical protein
VQADTLLVRSSDTLPGGSGNGTGDTLQRRLQEEYYQELDAQLPEIPLYTKDSVGGNWLIHDIIKHKDVKRNKKKYQATSGAMACRQHFMEKCRRPHEIQIFS